MGTLPPMGRAINEVGRGVAHATSVEMRVAQCLSFPKIPSAGFLVEDLASIVKPGIFIVDDVALPTPITSLVLPGEKKSRTITGNLTHKRYDRLQTKGYINRSPQSPSMQDMLYEITDAGKAALRAVGGAVD